MFVLIVSPPFILMIYSLSQVQRPDALPSASLDMYLLRKFAAFLKKQKKLRSDMVKNMSL